MAEPTAKATVLFGVDTNQLQNGLNKAEGMIKGGISSILRSLAPLAGGVAIGKMFSDYIGKSDALGKFADSIGESVTKIDAWGQAVRHAGGSSEGFQNSISSLNEKLQEFITRGEGEAKKVFETLGISARDANGQAKSSVQILEDLAGAAENMDKEAFAGIAKKLGLDKNTIMLLQSGKKTCRIWSKKWKACPSPKRTPKLPPPLMTRGRI